MRGHAYCKGHRETVNVLTNVGETNCVLGPATILYNLLFFIPPVLCLLQVPRSVGVDSSLNPLHLAAGNEIQVSYGIAAEPCLLFAFACLGLAP